MTTKVPVVLNYSHPLGETAKAQLRERIGEFVEVVVPCQIDFESPIKPQLESLVGAGDKAVREAGAVSPSYLIPPALSYAAAYVAVAYSVGFSDAIRPVIWLIVLKREGVPPQFVLADIV